MKKAIEKSKYFNLIQQEMMRKKEQYLEEERRKHEFINETQKEEDKGKNYHVKR